MSDPSITNELEVQENNLRIPTFPATRLSDDHYDSLKKLSRLPLTSFLLTVLILPLGLLNVGWIPLLNLIALCLSAFTMLSTAILFLFVVRARKKQAHIVQKAVEVITPLLCRKYDVDVTKSLVVSLMSGATLPLMVKGEVTRVSLKNKEEESILISS